MAYGARASSRPRTEPGTWRGLRAFTAPLAIALFLIARSVPDLRRHRGPAGLHDRGDELPPRAACGAGPGLRAPRPWSTDCASDPRCSSRAWASPWRRSALGYALLSLPALWLGAVMLLGSVAGWRHSRRLARTGPLVATAAAKVAAVVALAFLPMPSSRCPGRQAERRKERLPLRRLSPDITVKLQEITMLLKIVSAAALAAAVLVVRPPGSGASQAPHPDRHLDTATSRAASA